MPGPVSALFRTFLDRCATSPKDRISKRGDRGLRDRQRLAGASRNHAGNSPGKLPITYKVHPATSFGEAASKRLRGLRPFSHARLNPPYKKINSGSEPPDFAPRRHRDGERVFGVCCLIPLANAAGTPARGDHPAQLLERPYRPFREFLLAAPPFITCTLFAPTHGVTFGFFTRGF
jgi:hypothetical protein